MFDALDLRELLKDELVERAESGYAADGLAGEVQAAVTGTSVPMGEVERLYDEMGHTRLRPGWAYEEPSVLEEVLAAAPGADAGPRPAGNVMRDKAHAAWLGRCAGCNLGNPVEGGWGREKLRHYLEPVAVVPERRLPHLDTGKICLQRNADRAHILFEARLVFCAHSKRSAGTVFGSVIDAPCRIGGEC